MIHFELKERKKMSDIEVVALSLTAEYMTIDIENNLFKQLVNTTIPNLIERSQFNKMRRKLFEFSELIRTTLASSFLEFEDYFIIDSMPLEISKKSRESRLKICKKDFETAPSNGFYASQDTWFYGYKLHGICSVSGVFHSIDITKANVHDVQILSDVKSQLSDCVLLGDRGYLSSTQQLDLFQSANIILETPMRMNQKRYVKQPSLESQEKE